MSTTREEAGAAPSVSTPPGDRSAVQGIVGLRWWATLLIGLVLTVAGVAADLLRAQTLGVIFMILYPVGCVLAIVWARRSEMFGPMVQPPLLMVVTVPVVVLATGSLPASGGMLSTVIAIAGPLINSFPTMAITTAVCLAIGFVRSKLQPLAPADDEPENRPDGGRGGAGRPAASGGSAGSGGDRGRPRDDRPRDDRPRDDRSRPGQRQPDDRAPGVYRVSSKGETERVDRTRRPGPPR